MIHGGHGRVLHPPPEALQLVHPHLAHEGGAGLLPVVPEVVLEDEVEAPTVESPVGMDQVLPALVRVSAELVYHDLIRRLEHHLFIFIVLKIQNLFQNE